MHPTFILADSVSRIDNYLEKFSPSIAGLDTEASRLDTRKAKLAGISLSLEPGTAIYIPIGHQVGTNVELAPVVERMEKKFNQPGQEIEALFYNAKYDRNITQARANWLPNKFQDLMELVYLDNPDRKDKDLKTVAKEDLNYDMSRFESLFSSEEIKSKILDISTKDPARCLNYACADAEVLLRLYPRYEYIRKEFEFAVKIDTKLIDIVRKMEHNGGMVLNREYIDEQIDLLTRRARTLQEQIWRIVGYQFDIESPKQLGIALFEKLGIPNAGVTGGKRPQYKTDAETLEKLAPTYPIVEYVISYRKVTKAKGTYFEKLVILDETKLPVRFNFHMFAAPTFRFAAPGGNPLKDGFTGINIQAVSNGELRDVHGVDLTANKKDDDYLQKIEDDDLLIEREKRPEELDQRSWTGQLTDFAYVIPAVTRDKEKNEERDVLTCVRETCQGCPANCVSRGIDTTRRLIKNIRMVPSVRAAFMAPPGFTLVSFDYDRQELVIGANLSGEPKWISALSKGEDLHLQTACEVFNIAEKDFLLLPKEEYTLKRGIGKIFNFAIFYGATDYTLHKKANISRVLATQLYDRYRRGRPQLFSWISKVHLFTRKYGYTTTYFGRRRWLKQFYQQADALEKMGRRKEAFQMRAFADRSAVNTCIQGTGAEITRIAMVKVDKWMKDQNLTRKEIWLAMQLHDELTFAIRDELVEEISPYIREQMAFKVKSWPVQLSVGNKNGKVWGRQKEVKIEAKAA